MEIAINSLLIFLLLVFPGLIFRRFYYVGAFSKQFNSANWLNSFYISIIPGILTQILTLIVYLNFIEAFTDEKPLICHVNMFYLKLKGGEIPYYLFKLDFLRSIALYFTLLISFAALLAQLSWLIVRQLKLDIIFKPLRFSNHWHYYFSGEVAKMKDFRSLNENDNSKKVVLTEADVLVDFGNGTNTLYKGFLSQYTICKDTGNLKTIYLTEAYRYKITEGGVELKQIPGDVMVIPYEKVLNFNLKYVYHTNTNSIGKIIAAILLVLTLVLIMVDPLTVIFKELNLLGKITIRIWLFLLWANIVVFMLFILEKKSINKKIRLHSPDSLDTLEQLNKDKEEIKSSLKGIPFSILFLLLILYVFFY
jgi:hypothetical protein